MKEIFKPISKAALVMAGIGSILTPATGNAQEILRQYPQCGTPSNPNSGLTVWVTQYNENGQIQYEGLPLGRLSGQCGNPERELMPRGDIIEKANQAEGDGYDYGARGWTGGVPGARAYIFENLDPDAGVEIVPDLESAFPDLLGSRFRVKRTSPLGIYTGVIRESVRGRFGTVIPVGDVRYTVYYETRDQIDDRPKQ